MKNLKILLASVLLSLSCVSCWSAAIPIIAKVATVVNDANAVMNIIENATKSWFSVNPDPELESEADRLILNAWTALRVANSTVSGAEKLSQEEYDKAFSDFSDAYAELHQFLVDNKMLNGNRLGLGNGESAEIAPPSAFSLNVE